MYNGNADDAPKVTHITLTNKLFLRQLTRRKRFIKFSAFENIAASRQRVEIAYA